MSETLLEKLGRIEKELSELKAVKPVKQIDYSDDVLSIKSANTELTKKITLLSGQLEESSKRILTLENAKPIAQIDYSKGISILEGINKELTKKFSDLNAKYYELNKELLVIKNKKPVEQVDYSEQINALDKKIIALNKPKIEPIKAEVKKEIVHIDHSKELLLISNELSTIKQKINKKQEFDIKSEVEKVVNIAYINNLYRNK